ncbi:DUF362 domain-containing protein, partial [Bacteroidota bacterium]
FYKLHAIMKIQKIKIKTNLIITVIAIAAICLDMTTSLNSNAVEGTFRYESEFDGVTSATTKVAIVPSDYSELSNQVSRSTDPDYEQIEEMVRKAIELQGGLDWVIETGDKVMLKVNLVGGDSPSGEGENTDVRVVKALIKIIDEHTEGDVEIIVAEGTARSNDDPNDDNSVWDNSGYRDLLSDEYLEGINFYLFNLNQTYDDLLKITLGDKGTASPHNGEYYVHKAELEADVYIVVPVLKIHDTGLTNALKNQIGTAPAAYYGYNKMNGSEYYDGLVHDVKHRRWTTEEIVDLSTIADIDFVVVDAIMCLESYKTYNGNNQVRFNTIIAGADPVAVDHVSAKLFCLNPDDIAHITLAEKIGLGTNNTNQIEIAGASIEDVKIKVKKNTSENGKFGQSNRTWLLSQAYTGDDINEELISNEATILPKAGEDGWSEPVYFFDDRIDLLSYYNEQTNIISYAYTYFYAPETQEAELWIGNDEDIIVYINGESVYSYTGVNVYGDDDIYTKKQDIEIKQGENTLLVKTYNKLSDYSFALNICEVESNSYYAGNRVEGLKFSTSIDTLYGTDDIEFITKNSQPSYLFRNYPNPVNEFTNIEFNIPYTSKTTIGVYDLNGKLIVCLLDDYLSVGTHNVTWNIGNRINAGIYVCTLKSGNFSKSIKIKIQ